MIIENHTSKFIVGYSFVVPGARCFGLWRSAQSVEIVLLSACDLRAVFYANIVKKVAFSPAWIREVDVAMTWEIAILKTYELLGGCADNRQIHENIESFIKLTGKDREREVSSGRNKNKHHVTSHIAHLYRARYLTEVSAGHYCLIQRGRNRLAATKLESTVS